MESGEAVGESTDRFERRPRSRGVPAVGHKSLVSLWARLQLAWMTMYPLPRALLGMSVAVGVAYALVAALWLLPSTGAHVLYYVLPSIFIAGVVWCLGHGEPSDQEIAHHPAVAPSLRPALDDPQPADPLPSEDRADGEPTPKELSESDFDALEDSVDGQADRPESPDQIDLAPGQNRLAAGTPDERTFAKLVSQAIDDLPDEFARALDHVAVVISNQGSVQRRNGKLQPLYGLYVGYAGRGSLLGAPRVGGAHPDRIVIFRDTLTRDFGDDPDQLRHQVTRTLRHELAHHLGYDEPGVRSLGL